jgi:hypothetical protein
MENKQTTDYQQINLYLDKALNKKEEELIMQKINNDPTYGQAVKGEKTFREFIKNNVHRPEITADFIKNIRKKVIKSDSK